MSDGTATHQRSSKSSFEKISKRILDFARDAIALLFWIYLAAEISLNADAFITAKFPLYGFFANFKFVVFLILIATSLIISGQKKTISNVLYVIFFPLILISWKIPYFAFKQKSWVIVLSLINSIVAAFISFKRLILVFTIYILCFITSSIASNHTLLYGASGVMLLLLVYGFVRKFVNVFQITPVFGLYQKAMDFLKDKVESQCVIEDAIREIPVQSLTAPQAEIWYNGLFQTVLYNRVLLFIAKRLKDYQQSGLSAAAEIISTIYMIFSTTAVFAFVYLAIYRADPLQFSTASIPGAFRFLYYSFNVFVFSAISEVVASQPMAEAITTLEKILNVVLFAIFAANLISVKARKSSADIDKLVATLQSRSARTELIVSQDYRVNSIDEAINALEKMKSGTASLLLFLSRNT